MSSCTGLDIIALYGGICGSVRQYQQLSLATRLFIHLTCKELCFVLCFITEKQLFHRNKIPVSLHVVIRMLTASFNLSETRFIVRSVSFPFFFYLTGLKEMNRLSHVCYWRSKGLLEARVYMFQNFRFPPNFSPTMQLRQEIDPKDTINVRDCLSNYPRTEDTHLDIIPLATCFVYHFVKDQFQCCLRIVRFYFKFYSVKDTIRPTLVDDVMKSYLFAFDKLSCRKHFGPVAQDFEQNIWARFMSAFMAFPKIE